MTFVKTSVNTTDFINFRKLLHQFPEVSCQEYETKKRVLHFIQHFHPDETIEVGKTGLLFRFDGNSKGKSILVRAELDALPIEEINDFDYRSTSEGVSHKCGHDGHMAILSRLAYLISQNKPKKGTIYLLFQPAEENGMGAKEVYADEQFKKLSIDAVVSLHNVPGFPLHQICIKKRAFTPAVRSIIVKFGGKTSHAAEPEKGINPASAIAAYIQQSLAISNPVVEQDDFFLVTPIYIKMGEKSYGISAGFGEVHLTIRSWDNQLLEKQSQKLEMIAKEIAIQYNLHHTISYTQEFQANMNDESMVNIIESSAKKLNLNITTLPTPMKWGEDFGLFTENYKGAMFGLGSGKKQAALHNPDYDFPDELIETGSNMFHEIISTFLDDK